MTTHSVSPLTRTTLTVAERRPIVYKYRTRRYSIATIARLCGCSAATIQRDLAAMNLPGGKIRRGQR